MTFKYKTFQIKNESACLYKWTWSTLYLSNGNTNSCHRVGGPWTLDEIDFKDFHNHPGKIADRKLMLEGKWPDNACHYCKRIEDAGGISERTGFINGLRDKLPPEMEEDPTALYVTPRILEIYFSNLCNQGCTYCSPMFSSVIQQEVKRYEQIHGESISGRYGWDNKWQVNPNYEKLKGEFWKWMDENSTHLRDFQVLGGEPLFQPEFEECLSFFERTENPDLNWKMFSNLKHDTEKFRVKMERMADLLRKGKLRRIEIVCSIDCWGPEAEYARHGMKLDNWEDNFNILLSIPEMSISMQSTISSITLPTAYQLTEKVTEWNKIRDVNQGWNTVANPPYMDPSIFGHYMTEYVDRLLAAASDKPSYLDGFATQIKNAPVNRPMLKELRNFLDKIDKSRGQNWRAIYPWMDKIFIKELDNQVGPRSS